MDFYLEKKRVKMEDMYMNIFFVCIYIYIRTFKKMVIIKFNILVICIFR